MSVYLDENYWVPCSVKFPEKTGSYLVTVEDLEKGDRFVDLWCFSSVFGWASGGDNYKIHAWMPEPSPYEHDGYVEFHEKTIDEMVDEMEESE